MKPFENVKIGMKYNTVNGRIVEITERREDHFIGLLENNLEVIYDLNGNAVSPNNRICDLTKVDDSFYERKIKGEK